MGRKRSKTIRAGVAVTILGVVAGAVMHASFAADPTEQDSFQNLPDAKHQEVQTGSGRRGSINMGTAGLELPGATVNARGGETLAILGDLSPTNEFSEKYLAAASDELNLLRPDAVFTVGNLVPGLSRSGQTYASETGEVRSVLDRLKMPWYPCAGANDVVSGTRDSSDRRFEGLYQKYFGPLYYSANVGSVHAIVLDSEEGTGKGNQISDTQLAWLKADLNKTFESRRARWVVVMVHRPLWREESAGSNWGQVHAMLVDFNRRPIVSVEGVDAGGGDNGDGPRVSGVYAGSTQAYSQEPTRDGIHYTVLGPTAARSTVDASEAIRGFTLLRFSASDVQPSVVKLAGRMDAQSGGAIAGEDVITARERAIIDAMQTIPVEKLGTVGVLQQTGGALTLHAENPLEVPLDLEIRLASAKNYSSDLERENVNPFAESLDAPWEMTSPHMIRHLAPGSRQEWNLGFSNNTGSKEIPPPQLEFVLHWSDPRGRMHTVVLKRKIPVAYTAEIPLIPGTVDAKTAFAGDHTISGGMYTWTLRGDEPHEKSPEWDMAADDEHLFIRIRVTDATPNYSPDIHPNAAFGGLPSDALCIRWPDAASNREKQLWVLPFAPEGHRLWKKDQTRPEETSLLEEKESPGQIGIEKQATGYTATFTLERDAVFGAATSGKINLSIQNNDGAAQTWTQKWILPNQTMWGVLNLKTGG